MTVTQELRRCVLILAGVLGFVGIGGIAGELMKGFRRINLIDAFGSFFVAVIPALLLFRYARILSGPTDKGRRMQSDCEANWQSPFILSYLR